MLRNSDRITAPIGVILIASLLFLLAAARPGWGATSPVYTSTGSTFEIGNPQGHFGLNTEEMPARPNTLFPTTSDHAASGNRLSITGGSVQGSVYGGIAAPTGSTSENNRVTISGATIGNAAGTGNVTGGWSHSGMIQGNKVTLADTTVRGNTYGGWKRGGTIGFDLQHNTVTVGTGVRLRDTIYGAYTQGSNDDVHDNSVSISDNNVTIDAEDRVRFIAGAYTGVSVNNVHDNDVNISGGTIAIESIFGGRGQAGSSVSDNNVIISGAMISAARHSNSPASATPGIFGGHGMTGTIDHNTVTIGGGNMTATGIYGGYANGNGAVTSNTVTINDGTVSGALYGGYAEGRGAARGNTVTISGGSLAGDIYGGVSGSGAATGNTVTISGGSLTGAGGSGKSNILGGSSGGDDAFSDNVLNKNSAVGVGIVRNFETVNFGYTDNDNAGIDVLDTTATGVRGSGVPTGVTVNTNANTITFDGSIEGSGTLAKTGSGSLILTGDDNHIINAAGVTVAEGRLQIGDGGTSGSIAATNGVNIATGATLAYNHSDDIADANHITGAGKVIQCGSGTLQLTTRVLDDPAIRNTFSGGTEIASGTLILGDRFAYGLADGDQGQTSRGYITFTGTNGSAIADNGRNSMSLQNSFRTQSGAKKNYVNLTSQETWMQNITLGQTADLGGAFYVAGDTELDVAASRLVLENNKNGDETLNDLHVGNGGTFNLRTGRQTVFKSGITSGDGDSTLNIEASAPYATVQLLNDATGTHTFAMGTTNLTGSAANPVVLNLARANSDVDHARVTFNHTGDFISRSADDNAATVIGDGIIQSAGRIDISGTNLIPYRSDILSGDNALNPDTLTLDAPQIGLDNFTLGYLAAGPQAPLNSTASDGVPQSNNGLLDLVTNQPLSPPSDGRFSGIVNIMPSTGAASFDTSGDYLIIRSPEDGAFKDMTDLSGLTAYVGGAKFEPTNQDLRGSVGFRFGGEPATNGAFTIENTGGYKNVWLTASSVNSLTMSWTGGASESAPADHLWTQTDSFVSWQKDSTSIRGEETSFAGGDKVHVSGTDAFTVLLPGPSTPTPSSTFAFGGKMTVSGFVAGKDVLGAETSGGVYTIGGTGGITANKASAFGKFVNSNTFGPALTPTGKLEKFGDSTLSFENTGGNQFDEGIELHGGTMSFTRSDQLTTLHAMSTSPGMGIKFLGNAALEAREDIRLDREFVTINPSVTGTFSVAEGKVFTFGNLILPNETPSGVSVLGGDPSSIFNKAGPGTVRLEGDGSGFTGQMDVSAGTLYVAGDYQATTRFTVANGATLSGTGTIGTGSAGLIEPGGTLRPDGMTRFSTAATAPVPDALTVSGSAGLSFTAGSNFAVRIVRYGGDEFSDQVDVPDGPVTIDTGATLDLDIDPWGGSFDFLDPDAFTIITTGTGGVDDSNARFALHPHSYLPRGVSMEQGWGLTTANQYQLRFSYDSSKGFGNVDGGKGTHNESEIGRTIDTVWQDPGLAEIVDRMSDPGWSEAQVRKQLDRLTGDLSANALYMAFKEPWRHPFNRLEQALTPGQSEDAPLYRPRAWIENSSRYEDVDGDGNARGFTLRRAGVAFGVDTRIAPRTILGAAARYTRPHLKQTNGDAYADDYEFGLYGMAGLPAGLDMKMYLGYSRQEYEIDRTVSFPATPSGKYGRSRDRLNGETSGEALAASVELVRPIALREDFLLLPLLALDYEKAWMDGYSESGGHSALEYDDASMERLMFRFGLKGQFVQSDRLDMKAWAQYATRLGGRDYPSVGARFAGVNSPDQKTANIHGVHTGHQYVNLGLGVNWNLDEKKDKLLYLNYDVNLNTRMSSHAGELGIMFTW